MNISQWVKDLRAIGMTQRAIAFYIDCSPASVSHWELGRRKGISALYGIRLYNLHKEHCSLNPGLGLGNKLPDSPASDTR